MNQATTQDKKEKLVIVDWLIEHFPNAFFKKSTQVKPLQLGIYNELEEFYDRLDSPSFSKKSLKEALIFYSASPSYLKSQQEGAARIDLFGNEMGVVTVEQAKYAFHKYEQRYVKSSAEPSKKS